MGKVFRPSNRESQIISQIQSSKERARRMVLNGIQDCIDPLSNKIASKLIEENLVETTNKNGLEEQIKKCLDKLSREEDFDIDYQCAPMRDVVPSPHVVSLYAAAYVVEHVINNKDVIDIFGSDEEIYSCINNQVNHYLPY
jgi:vacuolar-type H+-ATPase subunit E/Vma4